MQLISMQPITTWWMPVKLSNVWLVVCGPAIILPASYFAQQNPPSQGREVTKLYTGNCAGCHGADMSGGSASSLADAAWRFGGDDASIANSIRDGHPDAGMPAMRQVLNDAEIRALVIYIHERGKAFEQAHTKYNAPTPGTIVQSEKESFKLESVMETGLHEPWAIAFLPDGRMLVTERAGRLRIIEAGRLLPEPVHGMPAVYGGEGGLLDVTLHPNYSHPGSDWIYLSYGDKSPDGQGMTAVIRGRLRDGVFLDQQQIFKADVAHYRAGGQRFGSRLLFDGKGHLFFSVGDRAHPGDEQDLSCPNGKVYRVYDDGGIPKDNPFVDRPGALPGIWTYGHRNPQGLVFSPITGELWEAEHGPRGGDELNILHRGHNYGWPVITYGMNYDGTPITPHTAQQGHGSTRHVLGSFNRHQPYHLLYRQPLPAMDEQSLSGLIGGARATPFSHRRRLGDAPGNSLQGDWPRARCSECTGRLLVYRAQPAGPH